MCRMISFILFAFLAGACSRKLLANHGANVENSADSSLIDNLASKWISRVCQSGSLHHKDLDRTVLGKPANFALPQTSWSSSVLQPASDSFGFSRRWSTIQRALHTSIYIVGKKTAGEKWIADGISEYEKRLRPTMEIQTTFLKSDDQLEKAAEKAKGIVFALDETGKQYTSPQFSQVVFDSLTEGGSHVSFIIGGAEGLPPKLRSSLPLISLSKLTFTHSHARLVLYEQLYRASEINKGTQYHK